MPVKWEIPAVRIEQDTAENSIGDIAIIGLGALVLGGAAFLYCDLRYGNGLSISWDGWRPTRVRCG